MTVAEAEERFSAQEIAEWGEFFRFRNELRSKGGKAPALDEEELEGDLD